MFGVLKPCAHGAAKYGIDPGQWQAHMCGLCLGLRDGSGQLARAATNTDAIVLSVLTEAQAAAPGERRTAGPCPLRGMRRASVVAADAPGVRLAATASLLLGAAKIRDHVDDGDAGRLARPPMRRVSGTWSAAARAQADLIGLDIGPLITAIDSQTALEARADGTSWAHADATRRVLSPITLDELTAPTQLCAATLFGHTATLAGRPENVAALREIGRHVGRIAHLADAVEDLERDRLRGRFNPLAATGTDMPRAYELLRESESRIRAAAAEAHLDQLPTVRWALLDPLATMLRRLGQGLGLAVGHVCRTSPVAQQHAPYQFPSPPGRRPPTRPGPLKAGGLILGVYCTGVACCVDHTSPCTGERKDAWAKNCDCESCCDCGDCCGNCCGEDCGCGDCCSCDCNC
ncbi:regulator [Nocardia asteroides NBRC 15531]|uniref:DUF5685 family protein n=1 Tax=Nocardia asteroides TaxID=1824 RepID=UPI0002FAB8ED|nr:DUF5685 family protein [Nocardia asteroides]TLF69267.1 regulator [Nocardia asteroides NBRC 15531]UGT48757.1 DUF5685 family protein [Nocardia asteroides]SFL70004.1 hypothetical protein SAMN05444423_101584 [Nocardia asteroides]VEG31543.1 Uncharacterised protein [Nocardia asteroides]